MIVHATENQLEDVAALALKLFPETGSDTIREEMRALLSDGNAAIFLHYTGEGVPVGFAQCQLRFDYVEGTRSSPVGYLEGIFVEEPSRKQGVAKELLRRAEAWAKAWAKEKGCSEFASDCELGNTESLSFHQSVGFREANRIICFTKQL